MLAVLMAPLESPEILMVQFAPASGAAVAALAATAAALCATSGNGNAAGVASRAAGVDPAACRPAVQVSKSRTPRALSR
jgi:hypothetical protein